MWRSSTALNAGAKTEFKEWEKNTPYFEGCLPIEVMAERGLDTLRFGPMKPVGLMDPRVGKRPHAVVQLRQDNKLGTLFNIVGFQTKLKYGAQEEIFRMIPGLQNARFARLGGIHRNTFLNSPKLLDGTLRLRAEPRVRFAGQVTGVEGYVESAAMGMMAGRFAAAERLGRAIEPPPATTALGALIAHVTGGHIGDGKGSFQPMNVNFGLFPEIAAPTHGPDGKKLKGEERGRAKKLALAERALGDLAAWLSARAWASSNLHNTAKSYCRAVRLSSISIRRTICDSASFRHDPDWRHIERTRHPVSLRSVRAFLERRRNLECVRRADVHELPISSGPWDASAATTLPSGFNGSALSSNARLISRAELP